MLYICLPKQAGEAAAAKLQARALHVATNCPLALTRKGVNATVVYLQGGRVMLLAVIPLQAIPSSPANP